MKSFSDPYVHSPSVLDESPTLWVVGSYLGGSSSHPHWRGEGRAQHQISSAIFISFTTCLLFFCSSFLIDFIVLRFAWQMHSLILLWQNLVVLVKPMAIIDWIWDSLWVVMVWNDSWWLHDLCVLSNMPAYSWWSTLYCIKGGWFIYFAINNRLIIIPTESNSLFCQNM
jgi:hypothetical protein